MDVPKYFSAIQWVPEDRITLFTSEGLIQIGGPFVPRRIPFIEGLDTRRRLCIFGFCRSIEMLSDVIEATVVEHGGEVVAAEEVSSGGLQKKLVMIIAVPLLWGIPPASETLRVAVLSGGGIVEKIYWQWNLFLSNFCSILYIKRKSVYKPFIANINKLQEMLCTNDSKSV
ncbi:hypothetical protein MUK42_18106 [Musa troglodytarum]|uniref:DUF7811 domain-containing protein n=1 Tax=Musa troglodytarum TaxID=320322 RepID=A0A9E7KX37_9LILI|nr:hypothetical protein MUK42_18106 [Musa troglodytarum]